MGNEINKIDQRLMAAMIDSFWDDVSSMCYEGDLDYSSPYQYCVDSHMEDMEVWLKSVISSDSLCGKYLKHYRRYLELGRTFYAVYRLIEHMCEDYNTFMSDHPSMLGHSPYTQVKNVTVISCNVFNFVQCGWLNTIQGLSATNTDCKGALRNIISSYTNFMVSEDALERVVHTPIFTVDNVPFISHLNIGNEYDIIIMRPDKVDLNMDLETAERAYQADEMIDVMVKFMVAQYGDISNGGSMVPVLSIMDAEDAMVNWDLEMIIDYLLVSRSSMDLITMQDWREILPISRVTNTKDDDDEDDEDEDSEGDDDEDEEEDDD